MQEYKERVTQLILALPFYIMIFFAVVHLSVYIQMDINGQIVNLSFVNQAISLLYLGVVYLWALFVNQKLWIRITALGMGCLSLICIAISMKDFGPSVNDAFSAGSAVLTLLYVFENAQYLLTQIKKREKLITFGIWLFVGFSVILFAFFSVRLDKWGDGVYFFGHRYASVCGLMTILITLKLLNRPPKATVYWILLFLSYIICFWTGARVYVLSGLGTLYAVFYTFNKGTRDFIFKCFAVTLVAIFLFFTASTSTKNANIVEDTTKKLENEAYQQLGEEYVWVNAMSNGRPHMWMTCWESYEKLPVINKLIGSGNKYIYDTNSNHHSHMDYLNILHYHGCVGLVVYLFLFSAYVAWYWRKNKLSVILLIGFWGIWFTLAFLNGYASYTANMMSIPYIAVMAIDMNNRRKTI